MLIYEIFSLDKLSHHLISKYIILNLKYLLMKSKNGLKRIFSIRQKPRIGSYFNPIKFFLKNCNASLDLWSVRRSTRKCLGKFHFS